MRYAFLEKIAALTARQQALLQRMQRLANMTDETNHQLFAELGTTWVMLCAVIEETTSELIVHKYNISSNLVEDVRTELGDEPTFYQSYIFLEEVMNNDILSGEWKQVKGEFIKAYGLLTNDDLEKARGERMQVAGLLQERYGQSEEEAKKNVDRIINHYNDMYWEGQWNQVRGQVQQTWGELTDNDLDRIAGSRRRLVGVLQEKYGRSQEQAWKEVRELAN